MLTISENNLDEDEKKEEKEISLVPKTKEYVWFEEKKSKKIEGKNLPLVPFINKSSFLGNYLSSGASPEQEIDISRKFIMINSILAIFLCCLFLFGVYSFIQNDSEAYFLYFYSITALILLVLYLRATHNHTFASQVIVFYLSILYIFFLFLGEIDNTGILWLYSFPLFALFLLGTRQGAFASLSLLLISIILMYTPPFSNYLPGYASGFKLKAIVLYGAIFLIAYVFEYVRSQTQEKLRLQNIELENSIYNYTQAKKRVNKERNRADKAMTLHSEDLKVLSSTAMKFVELQPKNDIYGVIAQQLKLLLGKAFVSINSYDESTQCATVRSFLGEGMHTSRLLKILRHSPVNSSYSIATEVLHILKTGKLTEFSQKNFNLCLGNISENLHYSVEKMLNQSTIYGIGFIHKGTLYGHAMIILLEDESIRQPELVEAFIHQSSIALQRWQAQQVVQDEQRRAELYLDILGHDINNRDQGILSYAELLLRKKNLDAESQNYVKQILQSAKDISALVVNTRKLTNLQQESLQLEKIDLFRLVFKKSERIKIQYKERKVDIKYEFPSEPIYVKGNLLLEDVIEHVLSNAVKYDRNERVEIKIKCEYLKNSKRYHMRIEDQGPGIADNMKAVVLERGGSGDINERGTGLGLTIVKEVVEGCEGAVHIEDRVAGDHTQGTAVVIQLQKWEDNLKAENN